MKKKFMMLAVLLGTLTLGSCIDDTESQSVTNVRDSKTEELKSIAAMEAAQAQAKITLANAEAAYKAALAEAEIAAAAKAQAEAELEKAQAELIELQKQAAEIENEADRIANEQAQAELEAKLAQLEVTKKENEAKLEQIAAEVEKQALENEKALVEAQKTLNQAQDALNRQLADADAAEKQKLQAAANEYKQAVENLINAQQWLMTLKTQLVNLETGLADAKQTAEETIDQYNNEIAKLELQNEYYKQYTNYIEDMDAAKAEVVTLEMEKNKLYDAYFAKYNAWQSVVIDQTVKTELNNEIYEDSIYRFLYNGRIYTTNDEGETVIRSIPAPLNNINNSYRISRRTVILNKEFSYESDEYTYSSNINAEDSMYIEITRTPTNDIRTVELAVNDRLETLNADLKNYQDLLKKVQAQYDGKAVYGTGEYDDEGNEIMKEGLNAVDSCAVLKKAWEDLQADEEATEQKIAEAKSAYENWLNNVELALVSQIEGYKNDIKSQEKEIKDLNTAWEIYANMDANLAALQAKIDARNVAVAKLYEDYVAAWYASQESYVAYELVNIAYYAKYEMVYYYEWEPSSATLIQNWIESNESQIEYYEGEIEKVAKLMTWDSDYNGNWTEATYDEFIAWKKQQIEMQEIQVAVAEAKVTETKAALDELMPSTSTEEGAE